MKRVDEDGREYLGADDTRPYLFAVSSGRISGTKKYRPFGVNPDVDTSTDPEYVWDGQSNYNYSDVNEIIYLLSSSPSDAGVEIEISGLVLSDGNWVEKVERLILNSTFVSAGNFIRVFEIRVVNSVVVTGIIQARTDTTYQSIDLGVSNLRAQISRDLDGGSSRNKSLMAMYTIPDGKTGFLYRLYSSVRKNQDAEFEFETREFNGSFSTIGITTEVSSGNQYEIGYEALNARTDLRVKVTTDTNNTQSSASFHLLIVDNDKLSKEFLNGRKK